MNPTALLLIDAQVNMFDPEHPVAGADALLGRLSSLLQRARESNALVVFVRNNGGPQDPDQKGTPGWELHPLLRPEAEERIFDKTTCNAFESTALGDELEAHCVKSVAIAGLQSEFCIRETTLGALAHKLEVTLVSNGHSTYDGRDGKTAQEISARVNLELDGQVRLAKADDVSFGAAPARA